MVQVRQDDKIRRMIDMVSNIDSCPLIFALASMRDIQSSSQVRWFSAYLPRGERVRDYHGAQHTVGIASLIENRLCTKHRLVAVNYSFPFCCDRSCACFTRSHASRAKGLVFLAYS